MNIDLPDSAQPGKNLAACKSVKAAFQENEGEFRNLVKNLKIGVVIHGVDTAVQYSNPMASHLLGLTQDQMRGRTATDPAWCFIQEDGTRLPPDKFPVSRAVQITDELEPNLILGIRRPDREGPIWVECDTQTIRSQDGQLEQIVVTFFDITAHKRAEEALIASEVRYRRLFETAKDGILILNADTGTVVDVNSFLIQLLGYTRELFIGKKIWELGFFKDIIANKTHFAELQEKNYVRYDDKPLETSTGQQVDVEFVSNVYLVNHHRVIQCNIRDITGRKRADAHLHLQSSALEAAANAIVITDSKGIVEWANTAYVTLTGYSVAEAIGKTLRVLVSGMHDELFYKNLWDILSTGTVWHGEIVNKRKDGVLYTEEMTVTPIKDSLDRISHFIAVKQDITARKLLESQFLRAQRMESIGTLAGGIAHDLNNGLAPILMAVEVLQNHVTQAEGLNLLRLMSASAEHCSALVSQVLTFARGVEGKRIVINPVYILNEIQNIVYNTFPKNIAFVSDWKRGVSTVIGDPTQLHQVFLNLCVNARDAMPNGGALTVTMENAVLDDVYVATNPDSSPGTYVMVRIEDTGVGIPPGIREKIFEPFFTTKEIGKGTGLGLSTTLGIVKSHGGFINLYSEMGKGTILKVYLPANPTSKPVDAVLVQTPELPRGNGELVLLVDDEERLRTVAQCTLERFGYRVMPATNGAEAIALYAQYQGQIAVVLTDMAMPVMDGPATIVALKTINPKVKVIGSSGLASNESRAKALSVGVKHFVSKPYTAETMLNILAEALRD